MTPNFHRRDAGSVKPESDLLLIPPQREVDGHQGFRTDVCWLRSLDDTRTDTGALTFSYNGQDDRVAKTSSAGTRRFVYDGDGRVLGEYGVSATDVKAEFIWAQPQVANDNTPFGGDDGAGGYMPLAVATPNSSGTVVVNWVHGNHLGVPLLTTDSAGNPATTPNDYQAPGYPGQSKVIADLYYNRYRDYDPTTGRYIQADPIGLSGGSNPYMYAGNNPLNGIDPSGLQIIIPVPGRKYTPFPPWLLRERPKKSPTNPPMPPSKSCDDEDDDACWKQYENHQSQCEGLFGPKGAYPPTYLKRCYQEALRAYKNCLVGDNFTRPFDPFAGYRGDMPF